MKVKKILLFIIVAIMLSFSSFLIQNRDIVTSASADIPSVSIWASCGTLTNGSLFKKIEVAVNDPAMVEQGFVANDIVSLRNRIITIFRSEQANILSIYSQKVFAYTAIADQREALLDELVVTENDENAAVSVRYLRLEFRSKRAFNVYSDGQLADTVQEKEFFATKYSEVNPTIFWGIQTSDTFVSELIFDIKNYFPVGTIDEEISTKLYYQYQTAYRRIHSNANFVIYELSQMYLHEWADADNLEFVIYRYEANRALWYTIALGATIAFLISGILVYKACKKNRVKKPSEVSEIVISETKLIENSGAKSENVEPKALEVNNATDAAVETKIEEKPSLAQVVPAAPPLKPVKLVLDKPADLAPEIPANKTENFVEPPKTSSVNFEEPAISKPKKTAKPKTEKTVKVEMEKPIKTKKDDDK